MPQQNYNVYLDSLQDQVLINDTGIPPNCTFPSCSISPYKTDNLNDCPVVACLNNININDNNQVDSDINVVQKATCTDIYTTAPDLAPDGTVVIDDTKTNSGSGNTSSKSKTDAQIQAEKDAQAEKERKEKEAEQSGSLWIWLIVLVIVFLVIAIVIVIVIVLIKKSKATAVVTDITTPAMTTAWNPSVAMTTVGGDYYY
jgi:hypothetical protein